MYRYKWQEPKTNNARNFQLNNAALFTRFLLNISGGLFLNSSEIIMISYEFSIFINNKMLLNFIIKTSSIKIIGVVKFYNGIKYQSYTTLRLYSMNIKEFFKIII